MIRFTELVKNGQTAGFCCEGHAMFAQEGQDIICSAVSVLTINTVNSIESLTEDAFSAEQAEDGGYLRMELSQAPSGEAQLLLKSLLLGIQSIQEAYGEEFLSVSSEELIT